MRQHHSRLGLLGLAVALALAVSPAPAWASGFQLVEQNGSGLGNAYAGQAAAGEDASTVYFNPAALTWLPGKQFVISASGIGISNKFADASSGRPFLPGARPLTLPVTLGGAGGDAGSFAPVPNAYFSWQAATKVWVGLGVNIPFGLKTEWDADWLGRFHAIKSDVKTININPSVAVKLSDQLSVGGGVSYQRVDATLSQSVAYGGISAGIASTLGPAALGGILAQLGGSAGLAREGVGTIKGDDWSFGWNAGLALKLGDQGRLGVAYRSRIKHELNGTATFEGAPSFATAGPLGALGSNLNGRFASGPVTAAIELPETISLAAAYTGDTLELLADWTWTGWSSIPTLPILREDGSSLSNAPLRFEDIWRVGLGVNYKASERFKVRVGTAYDKAPVQDRFRTPRLPDEDRTWAAAGFQYKVGEHGAVDFGVAHLFIKKAASSLPNQDDAVSAPTGNLIGSYTGKVNIVSIQYRHSF